MTDIDLEIETHHSGLVTDAEQIRIAEAISDSRSEGTRRAYESAFRQWRSWCDEHDQQAIPAESLVIASYLTERADSGKSVTTLEKSLAAIRAVHLDAGYSDPTSSNGVHAVMKGLRRRIGVAPRRQAHPISTEEIRRIVENIDITTLRGLRDKTMLLTAYAAALRRSELVALNVNDPLFRPAGIVLMIRRSKADQEGQGVHVAIARGRHLLTDPVATMHSWLEARRPAGGLALFPRISRTDKILAGDAITGRSVNLIFQERARAVGLADLGISGHSPRAGHATTASLHGVSAERLARTTRHANLATLAKYIRPAEVLRDTTSSELGL